jgi:hypothetical protein
VHPVGSYDTNISRRSVHKILNFHNAYVKRLNVTKDQIFLLCFLNKFFHIEKPTISHTVRFTNI